MTFVFSKPPSSGCKTCDRLNRMTDGRVKFCLKHDPSLSAEERKRYGVKYEQLPEIQKAAGVKETKRQRTEFDNLFGETSHGEERVREDHDPVG